VKTKTQLRITVKRPEIRTLEIVQFVYHKIPSATLQITRAIRNAYQTYA